jgi:hypothetical protein
MRKNTIIFILAMVTLYSCSRRTILYDKDCAHGHICCDIYCPCCPEIELRNRHPQLVESAEIENYVLAVNEMKNENRLEKISYPNMSACGGGLDGYYSNKKLVLINATYQAELGFSSRAFYFKNDSIVRIIYREHFSEWEKYEKNYPSDKYEFDASKMTYSDTLFTITLTNPILFTKQSNEKLISNEMDEKDEKLIEQLLKCGQEMKQGLNEMMNENKSPNR